MFSTVSEVSLGGATIVTDAEVLIVPTVAITVKLPAFSPARKKPFLSILPPVACQDTFPIFISLLR